MMIFQFKTKTTRSRYYLLTWSEGNIQNISRNWNSAHYSITIACQILSLRMKKFCNFINIEGFVFLLLNNILTWKKVQSVAMDSAEYNLF